MEALLNDWLWQEDFWLPPGTRWEDFRVGEQLPLPRDLLYTLPLAFAFIALRYVFERFRCTCPSILNVLPFPAAFSFGPKMLKISQSSSDLKCPSVLRSFYNHSSNFKCKNFISERNILQMWWKY